MELGGKAVCIQVRIVAELQNGGNAVADAKMIVKLYNGHGGMTYAESRAKKRVRNIEHRREK